MSIKIALFVAPLALDTFAIAILLGLRGIAPLRPAIAFALFEAGMPLVGLVLGHFFGARFAMPASLVGGLILIALGVHTLREALADDDEAAGLSFTSVRSAALAGFAISTDELAVGFPMGTAGLPIGSVLVAIALQAFLVTLGGIALGRHLGAQFGTGAARSAGMLAGLAFAALGVYLIVERFVPALPAL